MIPYRADIDGLRAISVLLVIFYHAGIDIRGIQLFPGGFIGVDVFFVISGFLIGGIVMKQVDAGDFSLRTFYERRARRILPTLFLVIAACIPFAWMYTYPSSLEDFSKSALAAIFSVSNFYFWMNGGYVADDSALRPLLHTWTLGVEEQYYILFPALMLLVGAHDRLRWWVLGAATVASLLLAAYLGSTAPSAAFFMLPSRAWELFCGALLACCPVRKSRRFDPVLVLVGLAMIVGAGGQLDDATAAAKLATAIPVAGALLVLRFAGPHIVSRLLGSPLPVAIGLISYSLYLWHQPVFAFARLREAGEISDPFKVKLIVLSFVLSGLSWWLVERPIRDRRRVGTRTAITTIAASSLALSAGMFTIVRSEGFPSRLPPVLRSVDRTAEFTVLEQDGRQCNHRWPADACVFGGGDVVLVGDSHAGTLGPALEETTSRLGIGFIDLTYQQCPFISGFHFSPEERNCPAVNRERLKLLSELGGGRTVILAAAPWILVRAEREEATTGPSLAAAFEADVRRLLALGDKVVVVGPLPEIGRDVPQFLLQQVSTGQGLEAIEEGLWAPRSSQAAEREEMVWSLYHPVAELPNVSVVDVAGRFCREDGMCVVNDRDHAFFVDNNHLTHAGAERVIPALLPALVSSLNAAEGGATRAAFSRPKNR
ncbi:acyltransferase family protein [Afifella sp. IM 167]|uniref:acyltransferase family protein n=1 Tax=Afifella sp. IM 167 TaxID=2033586 RepID=UPI001CCD0FC8|nr:acyltransferase family protein [Afifella sp. IM 167]